MIKLFINSLLFLGLFNSAHAIDTKRLKLEYGSSQWNENSKKIDTAFIYMKDELTGRLVKVNLEETEPDSGVFSGEFSIKYGDAGIKPQIFIPTKRDIKNKAKTESFVKRLNSGKIKAQPLFYHENKNGEFVLDVFDTEEQATKAKELHEKVKAQNKIEENTKDLKSILSDEELKAAEKARKDREAMKLQKETVDRERARIRAEQLALQKMEERKKKLAALAKAEQEKKKKEAQAHADKAFFFYTKKKYRQSVELYKKAAEIDPNNKSYYFQYGVALYRARLYNRAIVVLNVAETSGNQNTEKMYFLGRIHQTLKEFPLATEWYEKVKQTKHKQLAGTAAFYKGTAFMAMKKCDLAKPEFEWVMDYSSDPRLDVRAEKMFEKCLQIEAFEKEQRKKFQLWATGTLQYDSNVLLTADGTSTSSATNRGDFRLGTSFITDYKINKDKDGGWNAKYTFTSTTSSNSANYSADTLTNAIAVPWHKNGKYDKKNYLLTVTPGYSNILMDTSGATRFNPSNILNSVNVKTDWMLFNTDTFFSTYSLDIVKEDSLIASTTDTNADALKYNLATTQMWFLDKGKKKSATVNVGYTNNNATGSQKKYYKYDLGFSYGAPIEKWKSTSWSFGITLYQQIYTDATLNRKDDNFALSYGLNKVIGKNWTWSNSLSYTVNNSRSSSNQYSKYIISSGVTYNWQQSGEK